MKLPVTKSESLVSRLILDGCGNVGVAVLRALSDLQWPRGLRPAVEIRDVATWQPKHAEAGLVDPSSVGLCKAVWAARLLHRHGWPTAQLNAQVRDVRECSRRSYSHSLTLALTDSHGCKHQSVSKALQVRSPAISVGLGPEEAVLECYQAHGAHYCCVNGSSQSWYQRQPCAQQTPISTTETAWNVDRQRVLQAGQLTARLCRRACLEGRFDGDQGAYLRSGEVQWFSFQRQPACEGPHDRPYELEPSEQVTGRRAIKRSQVERPESQATVRMAGPGIVHALDAVLDAVSPGARYADRDLAWEWRCQQCGRGESRLHTVFPAVVCAACCKPMTPSPARVSGLSKAELGQLAGGGPLTLTELGLADETLLRVTRSDGQLVWVDLATRS